MQTFITHWNNYYSVIPCLIMLVHLAFFFLQNHGRNNRIRQKDLDDVHLEDVEEI